MKARTFFSALAIATAALLAVGVGMFGFIAARSPLGLLDGSRQPIPFAAQFVPVQAPMMASVQVRPERLADLWQLLSAPRLRGQTQSEIEQLERSLLVGTGLSYGEDIQPWLGDEMTFAVVTTDIDQDPQNDLQPGYLLALSCHNSALAQETLDLYWQKQALAGARLRFEQFAGSRLISAGPAIATAANSQSATASALVGDQFVLFANSPAVLKQALTSAQGRENLRSSQEFQAAIQVLPQKRVGLMFINMPESLHWLGFSPEVSLLTNHLDPNDGLFDRSVFSFRLHRQGLVADTALMAAPGHGFPKATASRPQSLPAAQFIPADVPLAMTGQNLSQLWRIAANTLEQYHLGTHSAPALSAATEPFTPAELVDWVTEAYAVALLEAPSHELSWLLAANRQESTTAALSALDAEARRRQLNTGPLMLGEQPLTAWSRLQIVRGNHPMQVQTDITGLRTEVSDYEVLASSVTAMDQALNAEGLLNTREWQQITNILNSSTDSYLYTHWSRLQTALGQRLPQLQLLQAAGQPWLRHVKTIAATPETSQSNLQTGKIFIQLSNL